LGSPEIALFERSKEWILQGIPFTRMEMRDGEGKSSSTNLQRGGSRTYSKEEAKHDEKENARGLSKQSFKGAAAA